VSNRTQLLVVIADGDMPAMSTLRRPPRVPWRLLATGFVLGQLGGGCIDRRELQCEEAVARIQECCPHVAATAFHCSHYESGCGEVLPEIDVAQSRCIRDASCGDLEARGICAWAASIGTYTPSAPSACP
jgi:hypothetical protein